MDWQYRTSCKFPQTKSRRSIQLIFSLCWLFYYIRTIIWEIFRSAWQYTHVSVAVDSCLSAALFDAILQWATDRAFEEHKCYSDHLSLHLDFRDVAEISPVHYTLREGGCYFFWKRRLLHIQVNRRGMYSSGRDNHMGLHSEIILSTINTWNAKKNC